MPLQTILRIPLILLGMSGVRFDLGHRTFRILAFGLGALIFWGPIFLFLKSPAHQAIAGAIAAWIFYYAGISIIFKTSIARWWNTKYGEENAYKGFSVLVGLGFLYQSTAQGLIVSAFTNTLNLGISPFIIQSVGVLFMLIGFTTKTWATYLTGLDTYYYKDLFVNHAIKHNASDGYVTSGPYRYFKNPMYGLGNLQAYGAALFGLSLEGLIIAAVYQATIYLFYYLIEKPFFVELYLNKKRPTHSSNIPLTCTQ